VRRFLTALLTDTTGTDLVEYTLLLAFITLVCVASMIGVGASTNSLWSITNARLASAASGAVSGS
jgi:Flp pilus assembly pilin Flp